MVSYIIVAYGQGLAGHKASVNDGLAIEPAEYEPLFVIRTVHHNPHPLARTSVLVLEFNFNMVARPIYRHNKHHWSGL